ncbi:hypothetical protein PUNSTDRAFT_52824 [Punctularia strigosozonata HHB-11173 SS5]|uniref:uncharacterized protein n=1 Tax=Punctularia strigosozonata (strain HHB-11173) TaxID=741275 RepID=UPI0004416BDB|nr:uncharacterized protein PUNSTDRAFT_52824 [Punctularia strigosozonata HHB-11173 SS5]EIN08394.1 hypothetical protein PUNSTDRAFT_52824 [Punctularia strigosozonata HHB-11173 SS5]
MAFTKNVEGMMLLEQPFARVPYENYRKVFRTQQKNIEKEIGAIQTAASDLAKNAQGSLNPQGTLKSIDGMIGRVESLKRKLSDLEQSAGRPTQDVMRERYQHLAVIESPTTSDAEYSQWAEKRLDRWIVDWALRTGKEKTARIIAQQKDIETLVDIDLFMDIHRVEHALAHQSCTEALAWCSENKTALRKIKSTLEFELRLQEYIELCRARRKEDAIAYTKKHLVTWQETHLAQIRQALGLLAFPPATTCGPYKRLYDPSRWDVLVQSFRTAIYTLNTLPSEPLLNLSMYAGLSALKLPACYDEHMKSVDCPVCDPALGQLAKEVPASHHVNSSIVCSITGKIMDEDNMPMALPNGYVYSKEALQEMAAKNDGQVTCPRTGYTCDFSDLRKVFIS